MGADRVTEIAERLAEVERHIAIERARLEGKDDHEETELDELARRAVRLEEELASGPRPRRRKARLRFGLRHQLAFFGVMVLLIAGTLLVSAWILALPLLALIGCLPLAIGGSLLYRAIFAKTQAELERVDF